MITERGGWAVGDADRVVQTGDVSLLRDEGDGDFSGQAVWSGSWEGNAVD